MNGDDSKMIRVPNFSEMCTIAISGRRRRQETRSWNCFLNVSYGQNLCLCICKHVFLFVLLPVLCTLHRKYVLFSIRLDFIGEVSCRFELHIDYGWCIRLNVSWAFKSHYITLHCIRIILSLVSTQTHISNSSHIHNTHLQQVVQLVIVGQIVVEAQHLQMW